MPLQNTLNVSELLKRLGIVGDSRASAPLLDEMRLTVNLADLSDLVPPVGTPVAGAALFGTGVVAKFNQWFLRAGSAGGLRVTGLDMDTASDDFDIWVADVMPFIGAVNLTAVNANFTFGQPSESVFVNHLPNPKIAPAGSLRLIGTTRGIGHMLPLKNWVGPGQFFLIEGAQTDRIQLLSITWVEYPGMINP